MNTLQEQDNSLSKFNPLVVVLPQTRNKVICWHLNLLSIKNLYEVRLQIVVVYGIKVVKIVGAIGKLWGIHPIYKVVVCREGERMQPARL